MPSGAYLVDIVLGLLSLPDSVLDHSGSELGVVEGVDEQLIIQDVALGLLQQPQNLVLQLLLAHHPLDFMVLLTESGMSLKCV